MNAKHSAILLSGLLLLMIGMAWAQSSNTTTTPTCPPLEDKILQDMLPPSAWVKANWNMNTTRWEIDCTQIDTIGNVAVPAYNATGNAMYNATNSSGPRPRGNTHYVNTNPYNSADNGMHNSANAVWANTVNANRPARKRRP